MKLWLITQDERNDYDTYDMAVVAAETEAEAQRMVPGGYCVYDDTGTLVDSNGKIRNADLASWATKLENVRVEYLGEAKSGMASGEICASFHAG